MIALTCFFSVRFLVVRWQLIRLIFITCYYLFSFAPLSHCDETRKAEQETEIMKVFAASSRSESGKKCSWSQRSVFDCSRCKITAKLRSKIDNDSRLVSHENFASKVLIETKRESATILCASQWAKSERKTLMKSESSAVNDFSLPLQWKI
jgi:hypothetical protein